MNNRENLTVGYRPVKNCIIPKVPVNNRENHEYPIRGWRFFAKNTKPLHYRQKAANFREPQRNNIVRKNISKKNTDAIIYSFVRNPSSLVYLISKIIVTRAWV